MVYLKLPQKYLLGSNGQLEPVWVKIMQFDISGSGGKIFLKLCSITCYYNMAKKVYFKFPKKCWGQMGNLDPFWGKIMQFIISGLALMNFLKFYSKTRFISPKVYIMGQMGNLVLLWAKIVQFNTTTVGSVPHLLHMGVHSFISMYRKQLM